MLRLAASDSLPAHLLIGSDAVRFAGEAEKTREAEAAQWRQMSLSTDVDFFHGFAGHTIFDDLPDLGARRVGMNPTESASNLVAGGRREPQASSSRSRRRAGAHASAEAPNALLPLHPMSKAI